MPSPPPAPSDTAPAVLPDAPHLPTIPTDRLLVRALERLGFAREGLQRERYLMQGELQDALLYGLLSREWEAG